MDLNKEKLAAIHLIAISQQEIYFKTRDITNSMISFNFNGVNIINPFMDETGSLSVDPVAYYGDLFLASKFVSNDKLYRHKESGSIYRFDIPFEVYREDWNHDNDVYDMEVCFMQCLGESSREYYTRDELKEYFERII